MDTEWMAALVAGVLVVVPPLWAVARHVVTLVHEAGHAAIALMTGRTLNGIRLHSDTSGLTVSSGKPRGLGMIATAMAGYLAPAGLGLGCIALVESGHTQGALWAGLATLAVMLLYIRNWFGLLVVVVAGATVSALIWRSAEGTQEFSARAFGWLMLLGAPRTAVDLWGHRRRSRSKTSDADVLAKLTHVPAAVWNLFFIAATVAAVLGALRLVDAI